MTRTIADWLAGLALRRRLKSRVRPRQRPALPVLQRRPRMNLSFLDGYKTYIVAAAMIVFGLGQLLGIDIPSFEGHSAGQLLMEGLAILFLRRGLKGTGN
ncbi:MAG TPA: hypothetical protein GYA10_16135 [Alphaproteobacteria bacterium]|nr:hypothetical protein [Alphaproteobacteria bacterium]